MPRLTTTLRAAAAAVTAAACIAGGAVVNDATAVTPAVHAVQQHPAAPAAGGPAAVGFTAALADPMGGTTHGGGCTTGRNAYGTMTSCIDVVFGYDIDGVYGPMYRPYVKWKRDSTTGPCDHIIISMFRWDGVDLSDPTPSRFSCVSATRQGDPRWYSALSMEHARGLGAASDGAGRLTPWTQSPAIQWTCCP